jgi:N-acetylmuramoyl-L-alanine amidase
VAGRSRNLLSRVRSRAVLVAVVIGALTLVGCSFVTNDAASMPTAAPTSAAGTTTTVTIPPDAKPGSLAVTTPTGVVVLWQGRNAKGNLVRTPCQRSATIAKVSPVVDVDVLIDPGHGGIDPGSLAETLTEASLNLAIAQRVRDQLVAAGYSVLLLRQSDYFVSVTDRATLAAVIAPKLLLSLHHNAGLEQPRDDGPGTEVYFRNGDAESRRLAGLLYEDVSTTLRSAFAIRWSSNLNQGARPRIESDGADFYGILRNTAGVPAVLLEAAYMSAKAERTIVGTDAFRNAEATGITRAIDRWFTTADPGIGYKDPVVEDGDALGTDLRTCVDPKLA